MSEFLVSEPLASQGDPLIGQVIGDASNSVRIDVLLGQGGMGRVYAGEQLQLRWTVAVKFIRLGLVTPETFKRFQYEATLLAQLHHPGIAQIYGAGAHDVNGVRVPYFVMEYIADAKTLTEYATAEQLNNRQKLLLFQKVCDAVAHGHQKGVIHRDLKPGNVLVDRHGQPKIIDFGVAKATHSDIVLTTMQTNVGQLIGTLQYMSPEQAKADHGDIDTRSDVYALGLILYELLADTLPYDVRKKAVGEAIRIITEDDPRPLSSCNRQLRGDVTVIAGKCLEKDRERRYSSAGELGADIERFLAGDAIAASPPGLIDGIIRLSRKHRAAAAAVVSVFAALLVVVAAISVFARREYLARRQVETAKLLVIKEKEVAVQNLYEANLYRLQKMLDDGGYGQAQALLLETKKLCAPGGIPFELACLNGLCDEAVMVLRGHESAACNLAFSADGSRLATGSDDGTVRIWDVLTGRQLLALGNHRGAIAAVAYSPVEAKVASCSGAPPRGDRTLRLWDAAKGLELWSKVQTAGVRALAFSPDGTALTTASDDGIVRLWDVDTGTPRIECHGHGGAIVAVAYSPDGTLVGTASIDRTARVWLAATGKQIAAMKHERGMRALVFNPDGTSLAAGSDDGTVSVWQATTGELQEKCKGHDGAISAITFNQDGARLATASSDGTARLWDMGGASLVSVLRAHKGPITSVAFSASGTHLATGSNDGAVGLWDGITGRYLTLLRGHDRRVQAVAFNPAGSHLATVSDDGTARLWDISLTGMLNVHDRHDEAIVAIAFTPDGTRLATGDKDGSVGIWDVKTQNPVTVFPAHRKRIRMLAFSSDGMRLATCADDASALLWDATTGRELLALRGHTEAIQALAFSSDGSKLATGSADRTSRLWDVASGRCFAELEGHLQPIEMLAFSPNGRRLVTGSRDEARLWQTNEGKLIAALDGRAASLRAMVFTPDGTRLATGSSDDIARLWDGVTGEPVRSPVGRLSGIQALAFSPDGNRLAVGSEDRAIQLWDMVHAKQLIEFSGRLPEINAMSFSPDGRCIATGSDDTLLRMWDTHTGHPLVELRGHGGGIDALAFSPTGTHLATLAGDGRVRLWGARNQEIHKARFHDAMTEEQLRGEITGWLEKGTEVAAARLQAAKVAMPPDAYRVACNMMLKASMATRAAAEPIPPGGPAAPRD